MTTSAGMLAYDPERLGQLASALGSASDALSALRCSDPEAQPALAAAAGADTALEQWRLTALAISGCSVLTDYRPLGPTTPDLEHAAEYVLAQLYGWRLSSDPTGTSRSVPPAVEAAALGYLLSSGQLTFDTAEQIAALQSRLGVVVADPAGRSAFAANLSAEGLAGLVAVLGHQRAVAVEAAGGPAAVAAGADVEALAAIASIDAVLASIATAIIDIGAPLEAAEATLAALSPYGAALLIAQLEAPDEVILALSQSTMARYFAAFGTDQAASGWELPDGLAYGIGDLLFPRITSLSPAMAAQFVTGLGSMSFELLTHTVHDAGSATALVARATDPAIVTAEQAGAVLVPLLRFLRTPPPTPSAPANVDWLHEAVNGIRPHLGGLIAPWLMQFTAHPEDWEWGEEEAAETFVFVIEDRRAWEDLEAGVDRWGDSILTVDGDDIGDVQNALEDLGLLIGGLNRLLTERAGQQAVADRFLWDLFVQQAPSLLKKATKAAGVTGIPARVLARITDFAIAAGADALEQHGAPGVPPPLADTLRQLELDADETLAFTAYLGMGVKIETLIERGELPADIGWPPAPLPEVCASGGYIAATNEWLDDTIHDDVLRDVVRAGRGAFIAGGQSADRCNEFRYG